MDYGSYASSWISLILGLIILALIGVLMNLFFNKKEFKSFIFYVFALFKYIEMIFMGLGSFILLICCPIFIPVVVFFKYIFKSRTYTISGRVITTETKPRALENSNPEVYGFTIAEINSVVVEDTNGDFHDIPIYSRKQFEKLKTENCLNKKVGVVLFIKKNLFFGSYVYNKEFDFEPT